MSASGKLAGKVAIVTGASRGIGRCIALGFASEGADVVIAAKSDKPHPKLPGTIHTVAEEVEALGVRAMPFKVDIRDENMIGSMVESTMATFGRIDVLINNAGALWWRPVLETPVKRYDLVNAVNVRGAFVCTQACLPHMLAWQGGHVVMFSPPIDLAALPGKVAYLISKFGMTMLALGLAEELRGKPVSVNALWPATMIESSATIEFQLGSRPQWRKPEILADALLALVTTPPGESTGQVLLDEDLLRSSGVTDFSTYQCVPGCEPPHVTARDLPTVGTTKD